MKRISMFRIVAAAIFAAYLTLIQARAKAFMLKYLGLGILFRLQEGWTLNPPPTPGFGSN
jgi:hypothetical protein